MNTVSSNIKPNAIEQLGNNTYYYNYNITSEQKINENGEQETFYNFIQIHLTGIPDYKDCIKNIIREYVSQEEEFDLINSYNKVQITGEKNSEDVKKYTNYINLLNESMTGFAAPPSATDSTTPLFKCVPGQDFYHLQVKYTRACVEMHL